MRAARALFAIVVLPGTLAGLAPFLVDGRALRRLDGTPAGWPVLALGLAVFAWCVRDFFVIGRGTLAPWDPPRRLVVVGLYRVVRNPMYVGVLLVLLGETLLAGSWALAGYTAVVAAGFHVRVVVAEEPALARSFPDDWPAYTAAVSRWWPRWPVAVRDA